MFNVPPEMVRFPMLSVSVVPLPGVMEPLVMVTAELVAEPVPEKVPPLTEIAPVLLVPLSWSVPALISVPPL